MAVEALTYLRYRGVFRRVGLLGVHGVPGAALLFSAIAAEEDPELFQHSGGLQGSSVLKPTITTHGASRNWSCAVI